MGSISSRWLAMCPAMYSLCHKKRARSATYIKKKKRTKVKKIENRETRNEKLKKEKKGKRKVKVGSQHKQLIWKKRKKEKEKDSRGKRTWKWALPIDLEICRNKGWIRTLNSSALVSSKSSSNSLRKRTYLVDECDYVCVCLCMSVCLYIYLTLCTWTFLCLNMSLRVCMYIDVCVTKPIPPCCCL